MTSTEVLSENDINFVAPGSVDTRQISADLTHPLNAGEELSANHQVLEFLAQDAAEKNGNGQTSHASEGTNGSGTRTKDRTPGDGASTLDDRSSKTKNTDNYWGVNGHVVFDRGASTLTVPTEAFAGHSTRQFPDAGDDIDGGQVPAPKLPLGEHNPKILTTTLRGQAEIQAREDRLARAKSADAVRDSQAGRSARSIADVKAGGGRLSQRWAKP